MKAPLMKLDTLLRSAWPLALLACAACQPRPDADDPSGGLFPLHVGMTWTYEVETDMKDDAIVPTLRLTVDRKIEFDGWDTWVRRNSSGMEYYIRRGEGGIRRVASRTDVQEQAVLDDKPRFILKTPLKVGDTWDAPTVPYLLRRPNETPRDLVNTHQAIMTYKVQALNETVTVPLGTYTGCALVRGEATLRLFTDPNNGFNDVPLISQEWYCPGVGLVRFEREETVPGLFMTGGKVNYVLTGLSQS
jgi:hypothetical protein